MERDTFLTVFIFPDSTARTSEPGSICILEFVADIPNGQQQIHLT